MSSLLKFLERAFLIAGVGMIALASIIHIDAKAHRQSALNEFERIRDQVEPPDDMADWSDKRKAEYLESIQKDAGSTLAVLRIPSRDIEVPVLDSTSDLALNRGAGHVEGTALPGTVGNIAVAAHRDGFFRGLKDIQIGDEIELTTLDGQQTFVVSKLDIVDPYQVSVLDPTDEPVLTLITCYPFYFVGSAPERFIVRATLN
jgi:sortase A